jgi:hypothetical protein
MLNETIDDEPVCVCVCVCVCVRILITKDKILHFSNYNVYNVRIYDFL